MSEPKLGEIIRGEVHRDAIHIAITPVIAEEELQPGDPIAFMGESKRMVCSVPREKALGIVDPYLNMEVEPGQKFYMFLMPGTVTGMRHHWSHPSFMTEEEEAAHVKKVTEVLLGESEQWLRRFANRWNFNFDEMVRSASDGEDWIVASGQDLHSKDELGEDYDLFWKHLENYTGKTFSEDHKEGVGWSCSC